jgi:predicted nucleotidyltransferase component of viral defense system
MNKIQFQNLPKKEKTDIFQTISSKTNIATYAVEKDWWVVQVLANIFEMEIGQDLVFKGGTSLSKAWNLIDRFSEDVDLAVDRNFFHFDGDLSKKQITELRKTANSYISYTFYPALISKFQEKGLFNVKFEIVEAESSDQDPRIIEVYYPNVIESPGYIQPKIQIEIGCRSLQEPFTLRSFASLVDEHYPDTAFTQPQINIPVVNPERTLLEKIFLLHEEFQRPSEKIRVDRLSRHMYDIYQLSKTEFAEIAINNPTLYETIVNHRYKYARLGGVDYNFHQPKYINPLPLPELSEAWKQDYKTMQQQMIYGDSPAYDVMLQSIKEFVTKINALEWEIQGDFKKLKDNL